MMNRCEYLSATHNTFYKLFTNFIRELVKRQAILPMHPDRQKELMITQAEYEMNKEVLVIDFQKIEYYLTKVCK